MYGSHHQGSLPLGPRARAVLVIGIIAIVSLAFGLLRAQSDAVAAPKDPKVTVCHATGSSSNPFVRITVSTKAADGDDVNDHTSHEDDVISPQGGVCPSGVTPGGGHKVDICHHTGSATNPIVLITVDQHAVPAHQAHGDTYPDATTGCNPDGPEEPGNENPGGKTPAASVVVTQTAAVTGSGQSKAAPKICTSRRSFRIRIRSKKANPVVSALVSVNGKQVKSLKGKRVTAPVVLKGLPKGRFLVKITATTRTGRKISGTRRYLTCTPKSKRQTIPLL